MVVFIGIFFELLFVDLKYVPPLVRRCIFERVYRYGLDVSSNDSVNTQKVPMFKQTARCCSGVHSSSCSKRNNIAKHIII